MNRREFLKSLLAFGVAVALPIDLATASGAPTFNIDTATDAEVDAILDSGAYDFEVNNYGTISFAEFVEPTTRAEAYGYSVDQLQNINDLQSFADSTTLNYRLQTIYKNTLNRAPRDQDYGWIDWLKRSPSKNRKLIYDEVERYLEEAPDYSAEWESLPDTANAQGAAYQFFHSEDWDLLDQLGIVIVDGEHPGSSYFAAELRVPVAEANQRPNALAVAYRFKAEA